MRNNQTDQQPMKDKNNDGQPLAEGSARDRTETFGSNASDEGLYSGGIAAFSALTHQQPKEQQLRQSGNEVTKDSGGERSTSVPSESSEGSGRGRSDSEVTKCSSFSSDSADSDYNPSLHRTLERALTTVQGPAIATLAEQRVRTSLTTGPSFGD